MQPMHLKGSATGRVHDLKNVAPAVNTYPDPPQTDKAHSSSHVNLCQSQGDVLPLSQPHGR